MMKSSIVGLKRQSFHTIPFPSSDKKNTFVALKGIIFQLINFLVTFICKPVIPHATHFNPKAGGSLYLPTRVHDVTTQKATQLIYLNIFKLKEFFLLGYNTVWSVESQVTFQSNMLPPSSGSENKLCL
jgi:hypothetical protein